MSAGIEPFADSSALADQVRLRSVNLLKMLLTEGLTSASIELHTLQGTFILTIEPKP